MPKVALADTLSDWERLLRAAERHAGEMPVLAGFIEAVRVDLDRLREVEARRRRLTAERQAATQELNELREHGKTAAICLRQILMSELGPRNEALVEFGMRPRRRRSRRAGAASAAADGADRREPARTATGES